MEPRTPKSEFARALDLMTRYLALRDHSRYELRTKLSRRFPEEVVEKVMTEAENSNWLKSEEEIAADAARSFARRGKSRRYIEGEMRKRHLPIPPKDDEKELENVRNLIERKFGEARSLTFEERAKAYRFLRYRGFQDRMIRMVFDGRDQD